MAENYESFEAVPSRERMKGHAAMLFSNSMWGLMSPVTKVVLTPVMVGGVATTLITPFGLSAMRIWGAAILFWVFSFILPKSIIPREKLDLKDLPKIFFASLLIITSNQALYTIGIGYTSPIDASVITTLTPIFTMIFAAIFIHEKITPLKALGVALGLSGALLLVTIGADGASDKATNPILGNTLCIIAHISAALYYVIFRDIISKYSPFMLMKWLFLLSAITIAPFTYEELFQTPWSIIPIDAYLSIAFIVIVATFIGYLLVPFSQRRIKPTIVSMYDYLQPVTSAFYSIIIGIAAISGDKLLATALIFLGVWVVTQSRNDQKWSSLLNFTKKNK